MQPVDHQSEGQSVADVYQLPERQARLVDSMLADEQWLASIGGREIITALVDADSQRFAVGVRRLKAAFVTARTEAAEDERENNFRAVLIALVAGAVVGSGLSALAFVVL